MLNKSKGPLFRVFGTTRLCSTEHLKAKIERIVERFLLFPVGEKVIFRVLYVSLQAFFGTVKLKFGTVFLIVSCKFNIEP